MSIQIYKNARKSIHISKKHHEKLKIKSAKTGKTIKQIINEILEENL